MELVAAHDDLRLGPPPGLDEGAGLLQIGSTVTWFPGVDDDLVAQSPGLDDVLDGAAGGVEGQWLWRHRNDHIVCGFQDCVEDVPVLERSRGVHEDVLVLLDRPEPGQVLGTLVGLNEVEG